MDDDDDDHDERMQVTVWSTTCDERIGNVLFFRKISRNPAVSCKGEPRKVGYADTLGSIR